MCIRYKALLIQVLLGSYFTSLPYKCYNPRFSTSTFFHLIVKKKIPAAFPFFRLLKKAPTNNRISAYDRRLRVSKFLGDWNWSLRFFKTKPNNCEKITTNKTWPFQLVILKRIFVNLCIKCVYFPKLVLKEQCQEKLI